MQIANGYSNWNDNHVMQTARQDFELLEPLLARLEVDLKVLPAYASAFPVALQQEDGLPRTQRYGRSYRRTSCQDVGCVYQFSHDLLPTPSCV